jgi:hypothetical protein
MSSFCSRRIMSFGAMPQLLHQALRKQKDLLQDLPEPYSIQTELVRVRIIWILCFGKIPMLFRAKGAGVVRPCRPRSLRCRCVPIRKCRKGQDTSGQACGP